MKKRLLLLMVLVTAFLQRITAPCTEYLNFRLKQVKLWVFIVLGVCTLHFTAQSQTVTGMSVSNISACSNGTYTAEILVNISFGNRTVTLTGAKLVNSPLELFAVGGSFAVTFYATLIADGGPIALTASLANGSTLTNNNAGTAPALCCTPSVSIVSDDADNSITSGTSVTFTATPTNGGTGATYQWKKNGTNVGNGMTTYTNASLENNDVITCVMTSNAACASPTMVTSNPITISIGSSSTTTNNALNFDGVDDYVNAGTAIANTTVFTLETWVNPATGYGTFNDGGAPIELISRWGAGGAGNASYTLGIDGNGKAVCLTYNGSTGSTATSATTIATNSWTHLAATRASDGTVKIYINGILDVSITGSVVPQSSNYAVFLAKPAVGTNQFKGSMDEVRIWNIVRTQSEISAAKNAEFCAAQTGLLAYYKMNEGTASGTNTSLTTITDESGSNTGTLVGFARTGSTSNWITSTTGVTGCSSPTTTNNALNFDGVDDYVNAGTAIANTTVFTLETWVNPATGYGTFNDGGAPIELISRWGAGGAGNASYTLGIDGNGKAVCLTYNGSTGSTATSATTIATNSWTHLAATRASDGTVKIYINGILDVSITGSVVPQSSNYAVFLAKPAVGTNQFKGSMDEVRIWNIVRTQSEISAAKNAEFCAAQTGLLAYYKMNEGTASGTNTSLTTIADASGSNTGTLSGFARTGSTSNWIASTTGVTGCDACGSTVTPSVSIASNDADNSITTGTSVTFTATPTNGGSTPQYQWKKGSTNVGANSATYTDAALANGDVITCVLTSSDVCASPTTATSAGITMTVTSGCTYVPSNILVSGFGCFGPNGTYTPNGTVNGAQAWKNGSSFTIQWSSTNMRWELSNAPNSVWSVNTTGSTTNLPCTTGWTDQLECVDGGIVLSGGCGSLLPTTVTPSVSIVSNDADNSITTGTSVTFTATPTNEGSTPQYQWKKGSTNVGNNSATYTDAALANGDVITCVLTSSEACASPTTATSAGITITVTASDVCPLQNITVSGSGGTHSFLNGTYTPNGTQNGAPRWANGTSTYLYWHTLINSYVLDIDTDQNDWYGWCTASGQSSTSLPPCTNWSNGLSTIFVSGGCGAYPAASVSIAASPSGSITFGTSVTFTASPTNGGSTPTYQWKKNGNNVGTGGTTYTDADLRNTDVITCVMTGSLTCANSPTTSNPLTMVVTCGSLLTPSVSIAASPSGSITLGTSVTFTATPTHGGNAPTYIWKKNGTDISGETSATYTTTTLLNNDIITCVMTSNSPCLSTMTATSNPLTMVVTCGSFVAPTVTISANPGNSIAMGTSVVFTASPTNGGTTPQYQWKKNGNNVGTNAATYTDATLELDDVITCVMTSNAPCLSTTTATSNGITMTVNCPFVPQDITVSGFSSIADGTYTYNGSFTWVNSFGFLIRYSLGALSWEIIKNSDILAYNYLGSETNFPCSGWVGLANENLVLSGFCGSLLSNSVTPTIPITANPSGSISPGTSVTFTAMPTNGGTAPSYQWRKNGINVGSNALTYTDAALTNNDIITCVLTSNASCRTTSTATSNAITMTVLTVTTYTWTGATSTDWATATNWNPNGIPSTIDNVIIPATANKPMLPANQTIANLSLTGTNKIMLGAYNLCVNAITGGSASTYIVTDGVGGLIIKALPTNAPTTFPIGASESSYDPLSISPTNSVDFTAKVKNTAVIGDFTGIGAGAIANFDKVAKREWDITPSATAGSTILTLTNGGTAYTVVGTPKVGHYRLNTGNTWEELSATHSNGTWTTTTSSFSPFGVGEAGGFVAVLPIELLDFTGKNTASGNLLTWTTANEVNNKGFQVERRQVTGDSWDILGFKTANNKSSTYGFTDNSPLNTSYYRLRQLDNDGKETLSKVISVANKSNNKLKVYPNPVSNTLTVERNAVPLDTDDFQIYNLLGQQVLNGKAVQRINVSALPQGTYFLKVGVEQVKFIKQE